MSSSYNNNTNREFQRRPGSMLNDYRYPMPMSEQPVEGAKYPARWTYELGLDGKIYFKVNDGVYGKDDRNAKLKEVALSAMDRNSLFNLMREACDNKDFTKAQYHVKQVTFGNGGRLNDHPSTLGIFTVVRNPEGKISVGYSKGTYKVMFHFNSPFESIILVQKDGEPQEDKGLMSRVYCKAFIEFSAKILDKYEIENYKPREKKDANNNGGGNNNNNGGNRSGGSQPPANSSDFDDVDF
ncbi:hypothetical protein [Aeromonas phage AerS_266]|nr:hypothetical protein [Aeromonas phage AerS_266]